MGRNDQVTRILKVIALLELNPNGLTVRELHRRLDEVGLKCSIRSVYRDLEAVERAHFPVTRDVSGDDPRWRLNSVAALSPNIQISYRELLALFISRSSLQAMKGSPVFDAIESFFNRVEAVLGPKAREGLKDLEGYIGFKSKPTWQSGVSQAIMDTVHTACDEGHVLEIAYRAASGENKGEVKLRRVGPEHLLFADSGMYLIASDLSSGRLKMYSLARMVSVIVTDAPYNRHGDGVIRKSSRPSMVASNSG